MTNPFGNVNMFFQCAPPDLVAPGEAEAGREVPLTEASAALEWRAAWRAGSPRRRHSSPRQLWTRLTWVREYCGSKKDTRVVS